MGEEKTERGDPIVVLDDGRRMVRSPGGALVSEEQYRRMFASAEAPPVGTGSRLFPEPTEVEKRLRRLRDREGDIGQRVADPEERRARLLAERLLAVADLLRGTGDPEIERRQRRLINDAWFALAGMKGDHLQRGLLTLAVDTAATWTDRLHSFDFAGWSSAEIQAEAVEKGLYLFALYFPELAAKVDRSLFACAVEAWRRTTGGRLPRGVESKWALIRRLCTSIGLAAVDQATLKRDWQDANKTVGPETTD